MKNTDKVLIVSIALISTGIFLFVSKKGDEAQIETPNKSDAGNSQSSSPKLDLDKILKKGSKGAEVGILQKALNNLQVDNDFGALTEARLKAVMRVTQTSLNDYNKFIKKIKYNIG